MKTLKKRRLRLLWQISRGGRLLYLSAILSTLLSVVSGFLMPQVTMFVVDCLLDSRLPAAWQMALVSGAGGLEVLRRNIPWLGALALGLSGLSWLFYYLRGHALSASAQGMVERLRNRLFRHIGSLPFSWHIGAQTGDIIQRCTADVEIVKEFLGNQLVEIVRTVSLVAVGYSLLFPLNFAMALTSFLFLPVIFGYSYVFLRLASKRFLAADEAEGELLSIAQENFTGIRVIKAFGRERQESDKFGRQNDHYAGLWMRLGRLLSLFWGVGDLIPAMQLILICVVGVHEAMAGRITVGAFMVFLTYNGMTIWPVRGLGRILSEASKTSVSLGRIGEILAAEPERDPPGAIDRIPDGDIAFSRVSFRYGDAAVLRDVSFTVKKGQTLGILGATGSGKTTIAHLLCRLYDPAPGEGQISIGGVDIRRYALGKLRRGVGVVLQEPFLYYRSIGENIAALHKTLPARDIEAAAGVAAVSEAISEFRDGYETIVGERGVTLSGGQKQRVAIARAVLQHTPILIFDDSLSAVDTETDARIRAALRERTAGATVIIIAHRLSSVAHADQVLVLENGAVAERGAPEELLRQNGIYRRLHDLQEQV